MLVLFPGTGLGRVVPLVVASDVILQADIVVKFLRAELALVWFLSSVDPHVTLELGGLSKQTITYLWGNFKLLV